MNYKTYAEAKIANPDCEIVTTGKNCAFVKTAEVIFEALLSSGNGRHKISDDCWAICNPADYCSTLKEFLDAGFNFAIGDLFLGTDGTVHDIEAIYPQTNKLQDSDDKRYILSAAALNGGCKIPNVKVNKVNYTIDELLGKYAVYGTDECELFLDALESSGATWPNGKKPREDSVDGECVSLDAVDGNIGNCRKKYYEEKGYQLFTSKSTEAESEPWTIYNNTLPLYELGDEQAAQLFNAWRAGEVRQAENHSGFVDLTSMHELWINSIVYRIKQKSERDLFIEASVQLMTSETERTMEQMFGAQFDAGARYTDLTQHFGENI